MDRGDADPIARLRARTVAAAAELASITSRDAAASGAVAAIGLTRLTLDTMWLPALDTLLATAHRAGAPRPPSGQGPDAA